MSQAFIQNVRNLKGLAPNAGNFNRIAQNLDLLNVRVRPIHCLLSRSADKTITFANTGAPVSFDYDTLTNDADAPFSLFSAGSIIVPDGCSLMRIILNIAITGGSTAEFVANGTGLSSASFGTNTTKSIVSMFGMDSGWQPVNPGIFGTISVGFNGVSGSSFVVKSSLATWASVEVI